MTQFSFACPRCRIPLTAVNLDTYRCPVDGSVYRLKEGIWRFLLPERADYFKQFIEEYETVRSAEGWGLNASDYYLALPFADLSGRFPEIWRIRARGYRLLISQVVEPLTEIMGHVLKIADLGSGNCWLANRLSLLGHKVAAIDLLSNQLDGLGVYRHYETEFVPIQAEFDRLPLEDREFDLVVLNGTLHYSTNAVNTLAEALRVLKPDGLLAVMDSPTYHDSRSGDAMVQEREVRFEKKWGFRGDSLPNENFLTYDQMNQLADVLHIDWKVIRPFYGMRWWMRPHLARLLRTREPATFQLAIGRRRG